MAFTRRTAAQKRATKRLIAFNKRRARGSRANTSRRKTKRPKARVNKPRKAKKSQCNPRRRAGITVAQAKRLYQLGKRSPQKAVAIKKTRKGYSIVTGAAARRLAR